MKQLTGLSKELALFRNAGNPLMRSLPLHVKFYLHGTFKNEKVTDMGGGQYVISTFMPPFPSVAFDRMIQNSIDVYHKKVSPYSTYCAITNQCGYNCWHCSKAHRHGNELSTGEWKNLIREILDIGVCVIGFTGGEPLYRNDLEEMIASIGNRAASILFTTGDGFSEERAQRLKESGLTYVAVSLDHYEGSEHNRLRGSAESFQKALDAINKSRKVGFYTALQLTMRKNVANRDFLDSYLQFASTLGVQEIRVIEPMPTGKLIDGAADVFLDEKERQAIREFHIQSNHKKPFPKVAAFAYLEDKNLYGCGAGVQHLYIDAYGNLNPCDFTPLSFGSVLNGGFKQAFSRLQKHFSIPRDKCFILENMGKLKSSYEGNLPLGYEESDRLCVQCSKGKLPKYYRKLGWNG